jgi:hypothetical protein
MKECDLKYKRDSFSIFLARCDDLQTSFNEANAFQTWKKEYYNSIGDNSAFAGTRFSKEWIEYKKQHYPDGFNEYDYIPPPE